MQAALSIGRSFAELFVCENESVRFVKRFYMPSESLSTHLKKTLDELENISQLTVSSRRLEKIFATKLGGSVAQVVTSGFQSWPVFRQPTHPRHFEISPSRFEPLASQDLIFGVTERIDSTGAVTQALAITELEFISQKLKMNGTKRICINFLHSNINSCHQEEARKYFIEQGFQVFSRKRPTTSYDEMPSWRVNLLNACLAGSFEDLTSELQEVTTAPVYFLNGNGASFSNSSEEVASSLFAWAECLTRDLHFHSEILLLDLENWSWISTKNRNSNWESPWGIVDLDHPQVKLLKVQPTDELQIDFTGCLGFSNENLGYEPGPMSFGRGLKPLVFDALVAVTKQPTEQFADSLPQVNVNGQQKYLAMSGAWIKHHKALSDLTVEELNQEIASSVLDQIGLEVCLATTSRKILVTGFFANSMFSILQKKFPHIEWMLDSQASTRLGSSLFECSREKK